MIWDWIDDHMGIFIGILIVVLVIGMTWLMSKADDDCKKRGGHIETAYVAVGSNFGTIQQCVGATK